MKLTAYWKHFLEQVNLNQSRIDQLDDRVTAITNFLQGETGFGSDAEDVIPQGSYAQKTILKPVGAHEFDADVLLQMTEQDDWEPCDYVAELYRKFRGSSTYKELVSRRTRCVVVNYANEFHVDVVPYLVRDDGHWITNRAENKLENTNPEGFNDWLDARDRIATRRLVEVIRVMKYLRDFKQTFSVRSVVLSFLLADRVSELRKLTSPGCYADLPTAFVTIVEDLDAWLQARPWLPPLTDPSCPSQNFHDRWNQEEYANFRNKIHDYAAKARNAYDLPQSEGVEASVKAWQELFGPKFCKPPAAKSLAEAASLSASTADNEQDIEVDLGFPISLGAGYEVVVRGRVRKKSDRLFGYDLARHGNRVKKSRSLAFEITRCTVPKPYDIYWKVRNDGEEAARLRALRGQIKLGSEYHSETTAYRGNHYVEVYIVKSQRCVAIDRQRVTIY